jgi:hypothetical protein
MSTFAFHSEWRLKAIDAFILELRTMKADQPVPKDLAARIEVFLKAAKLPPLRASLPNVSQEAQFRNLSTHRCQPQKRIRICIALLPKAKSKHGKTVRIWW